MAEVEVLPSPREVLLAIEELSVGFGAPGAAAVRAVDGVSFTIAPGERLALVGESGSGKSVTALAALGLLDAAQAQVSGSVRFAGQELRALPEAALRRLRGREIGLIFQEPMNALNPLHPVGRQIAEGLRLHFGLDAGAAWQQAVGLLERTGIPEPQQRALAYPHMLSGGQRQRAMIAMALACRPKLLIADEPTTALDVTLQVQVLDLLRELQVEFGMAILFISHDLNLVRRFAGRVCVMHRGRIVEQGSVETVFTAPREPYTRTLLASRPQRLIPDGEHPAQSGAEALLSARGVDVRFVTRRDWLGRPRAAVHALVATDLDVHAGETLGIVGESGSGKSTLGLALLRLLPAAGCIVVDGQEWSGLGQRRLRPLRPAFQVVFQDPFGSLSPRMTVEDIVGEGLRIHRPALDRAQRRTRIVAALDEVGLPETALWRYPHEFSGGQRQRIAIARALVLEPKLLLLDEPTSALDATVQKQVLALLRTLQQRHGMSYLFISHDLAVIRALAHRVLVLRGGQVVESGETAALFSAPQHPYTAALLEAALLPGAGAPAPAG